MSAEKKQQSLASGDLTKVSLDVSKFWWNSYTIFGYSTWKLEKIHISDQDLTSKTSDFSSSLTIGSKHCLSLRLATSCIFKNNLLLSALHSKPFKDGVASKYIASPSYFHFSWSLQGNVKNRKFQSQSKLWFSLHVWIPYRGCFVFSMMASA